MGTPNSILRRTLEFSDAEFYWIWSNEFCIWLKNLENWKDKRILRQQTIRALAIFVEENASHQKVEYLNRRWDWCQKQLHDFNFSDVWDSARARDMLDDAATGLINWIRAFSGTTQSARLAPKRQVLHAHWPKDHCIFQKFKPYFMCMNRILWNFERFQRTLSV